MRRLLSLIAFLPSTTAAQTTPEPPAEAPLEVQPPPEPEPSGRVSTGGFAYHLYGFLRLKGGIIADDPNVAFVGRNDGFVLQNARIGLAGGYGDRLGFRISADGAVDERVGANATEGILRFALKDAYLDVHIVPQLSVRIVRFEPIFDLEEIVPYTERAFIDRALESRGVLATQGYETAGLSPGRSIGVALRSDRVVALGPAALGYELAVTNGNGEYEAQNDNDHQAYSAAVFVTWGPSVIFAAGRQKSRTVGELPFRQTEDDLAGAAGMRLVLGPVELAAQGIARHTTFPTTGGPAENSAGAHAQLAVALALGGRARLVPGYRYAIYDPSDLITTDLVQEHTFGATLGLNSIPLRLQVNYTHAAEEAQRSLANDRFEIGFEVSL
jgi:hypothetical protein